MLRVPPDRTYAIAQPQLDDVVKKQFAGKTLNTTSSFLKQLLPRERLPFPVNEDLLSKLSTPIGTNPPIWNEHKSCFCQPPMNCGEAAIGNWLNNIGVTMGLVYGRQCERLWWSGNCGTLVASSIQRNPLLILLDRIHCDRAQVSHGISWAFVKALVEVYHIPDAVPEDMISGTSYLTFLCQPHRRFTISLFFINAERARFSITVTDHVGQIRANQVDLMGPSSDDGLLLLSTLAFLMFGSPEDIGLDPNFEINPSNGQVVAIECENRRFEVVQRIHALQSLFGRGTQVWIVVHNGIKYVMKDSWVREDDLHNEVVHLRKMEGHKELEDRVPTLFCGGDVVINGVKDSMRRYRCAPCLHHIHRRIVTSTVGEPITSFKSKKEFIRVLISIIETHRYLYNRVGILHCDLSTNNVLLVRKDNESEATGLLINYDYSLERDLEAVNHQDPQHMAGSAAEDIPMGTSEKAQPPRGTPPFMAIEALLATNFIHKPQHDLESILYIILFICTCIRGPGLLLDKSDVLPPSLPIRSWFTKDHIRAIGYRKLVHLEHYDIAILPNFMPYWHDFAPFIKDLIIACFPVKTSLPNKLEYEQVLRILEIAYGAVKEPSDQVPRASEVIWSTTVETVKQQSVASKFQEGKVCVTFSLCSSWCGFDAYTFSMYCGNRI